MNLKDITEELRKVVTIDRFNPVEKIVYGFVSLILTSVVIALITLVLRK